MSSLVPNLGELVAALPSNSDGVAVAVAFDTDDVAAARIALRAVLAKWEDQAVAPDPGSQGSVSA